MIRYSALEEFKVINYGSSEWVEEKYNWFKGYYETPTCGPTENEICTVIAEDDENYYLKEYKGGYRKGSFAKITNEEADIILQAMKNEIINQLLHSKQEVKVSDTTKMSEE